LSAIKNVGASPIECILSARNQGGEFKSIEDFCHRVDLRNTNKKVLESLIKAGAFDSLGSRGVLLKSIDKIISAALTEQRMKESGQVSMFGLWAQTSSAFVLTPEMEKGKDASLKQKLNWERELLGVYFSEHPLYSIASELPSMVTASCGEINAEMANETVIIAGMVASVRQAYTRDKRSFVIAALEDLNGSVEVTAWPKLYENTKELWQQGNILIVEGVVKVRDGRIQLNCQRAQRYHAIARETKQSQANEEPTVQKRCRLVLSIDQTDDAQKDVERLRKVINILESYPGRDRVSFAIIGEDETTNLEMPGITINYCPELASELSNILGEGNLRLEQQLI
jgi:DNA polymerase-3 subunit alpha